MEPHVCQCFSNQLTVCLTFISRIQNRTLCDLKKKKNTLGTLLKVLFAISDVFCWYSLFCTSALLPVGEGTAAPCFHPSSLSCHRLGSSCTVRSSNQLASEHCWHSSLQFIFRLIIPCVNFCITQKHPEYNPVVKRTAILSNGPELFFR